MADYRIKTLSWLAPVALVGTVGLAACGDEDASESTRSVSPAAAAPASGFDVYLNDVAADPERRIAVASSAAPASGFDVYLSDLHGTNQAAEDAERQTKLDNAAETYANSDEPESANDDFVPGTRRMPTR